MFLETKSITAYNSKQVAFPVGVNQDAYYILSFFRQDINTLDVHTEHSFVKNNMSSEFNPKIMYKEGTKFREKMFNGTYKECQDFIVAIVEQEKEWIRDERFNYIYPI